MTGMNAAAQSHPEPDKTAMNRERAEHRRAVVRAVRAERERLTSTSGTRPAFDYELILTFARNRLSAAYAVHPAFAGARIVEIGAGLRPAYPDHLPRITICGDRIRVNGLYRHGFLLAPALAELTAAYLTRGAIDNEVMRWS